MAQHVTPEWTLGDRLRKARTRKGISVQAMADYLGVIRNTVTNYEGDKNKVPRTVVYAYASFTDTPLEWLLEQDVDVRERAADPDGQLSGWMTESEPDGLYAASIDARVGDLAQELCGV